jgi:hypothetical protein
MSNVQTKTPSPVRHQSRPNYKFDREDEKFEDPAVVRAAHGLAMADAGSRLNLCRGAGRSLYALC